MHNPRKIWTNTRASLIHCDPEVDLFFYTAAKSNVFTECESLDPTGDWSLSDPLSAHVCTISERDKKNERTWIYKDCLSLLFYFCTDFNQSIIVTSHVTILFTINVTSVIVVALYYTIFFLFL